MLRRIAALLLLIIMTLTASQAAHAEFAFSFLPTREHNGVVYQARPPAELTTVLLIGYDHMQEGEQQELHGYSNGGQADFLMLVVADHANKTVRMLQIDRDTMTPVIVSDQQGRQYRLASLQICLAHAYGNTREKNNANTIKAVEMMLGIDGADDGAQIDWYLAMDISGIARLNDLLGGVTVTIEEDMSHADPEMTEGATLTLTGEQARIFCRSRYKMADKTNAMRMKRQRQYISAAGDVLVSKVRANANFGYELLEGMGIIYDRTIQSSDPFSFSDPDEGTPSGAAEGHYLMSSETMSGIVGLLAKAVDYEIMEIETLPGKHSLSSDGYIHYDLEQGAAIQWALDAFYRTGK